jgi:cell wall-associated NlpC family hydrolase
MALFGAAGSVVSRALVELDIDAHNFDRKLDEADARLREHGNVVGKTLKASYLAGAAGAAILIGAVAESTKVAIEAQAVRAREQAQLKALGISYTAHRAEIDKTITSLRKMSGFNDEQLTSSFTKLVASTHNVAGANKDLALAVDVARARNISLEAATALVTKASIGQVGALNRMGIAVTAVHTAQNQLTAAHVKATPEMKAQAKELDKIATAHKELAILQARYAGQASAYGKTAAGEYDRMKASVRSLEERIGTGLLPVLAKFFEWILKLLDKLGSSRKAHELLAQAVTILKDAWRVAVEVLKLLYNTIQDVARFLDKHRTMLGLVKDAVVGLVAAYAAYRATLIISTALTTGISVATTVLRTAYLVATGQVNLLRVAQWQLNAAMDANPIGLIIVAVAALAAGFYELYKHCKTFRNIVNAVFGEVTKVIQGAVGFIKQHWELLGTILLGPFFLLGVEIVKHFDTVKKMITNLYHWLEETGLKVALAIVEPFSHLPGSMGKWARNAKDAIKTQLDQISTDAAAAGAAAGTAFASNFQANSAGAVATLTGGAAAGAAGVGGGTATGKAGAGGKTVRGGYNAGSGSASLQQAGIVNTARSQIGISYQLGGPAQLGKHTDCSGLAVAVLRQNGISVSGRTTWDLVKQGTPVTWQTLQAGDLVFFSIPEDGGSPPQHVGIYIGSGMMIHDPHTGASVETVDLNNSYWRSHYYAARRYVKTAAAKGGGGGGGGGATGDAGAGASGVGVTSSTTGAGFSATVKAAPKAGGHHAAHHAHHPHKPTIAGVPAIDSAKRQIVKDYDALAAIHAAGLDGVVGKVSPKLAKIRDELGHPMTTKELAMVRNQLANVGVTISKGLTRAHAIIQAKKGEFEKAWAQFASGTMTAFDRVTQAHLTKMATDTAAAIKKLSVTVNGPGGPFAYTAGALTPAQQALKDIQEQHDQKARDDQLAADRKALADNTDPTQKVALQKAIDDDLYQQKLLDLQKQGDLEQKAADEALTAAQDAAQRQADQEARDYQDQRDIARQALQNQLDDLEKHLEARTAKMSDANQILAGVMAQGGADIGNSFIQGLKDSLASAGLDLTDYLGASSGGASSAAAGGRPDDRAGAHGVNGTPPAVVQHLHFNDNRPAVPAAHAAKHAASRVWLGKH